MIESLSQVAGLHRRSSVCRVHCLTYAVARLLRGTPPSVVILAEDRYKAPYNLRLRNNAHATLFRYIVAVEVREMRREGHWRLVKVDGTFEVQRV